MHILNWWSTCLRPTHTPSIPGPVYGTLLCAPAANQPNAFVVCAWNWHVSHRRLSCDKLIVSPRIRMANIIGRQFSHEINVYTTTAQTSVRVVNQSNGYRRRAEMVGGAGTICWRLRVLRVLTWWQTNDVGGISQRIRFEIHFNSDICFEYFSVEHAYFPCLRNNNAYAWLVEYTSIFVLSVVIIALIKSKQFSLPIWHAVGTQWNCQRHLCTYMHDTYSQQLNNATRTSVCGGAFVCSQIYCDFSV